MTGSRALVTCREKMVAVMAQNYQKCILWGLVGDWFHHHPFSMSCHSSTIVAACRVSLLPGHWYRYHLSRYTVPRHTVPRHTVPRHTAPVFFTSASPLKQRISPFHCLVWMACPLLKVHSRQRHDCRACRHEFELEFCHGNGWITVDESVPGSKKPSREA